MADDRPVVFAKFKMNKNRTAMTKMIFSSDRTEIDVWQGDDESKEPKERKQKHEPSPSAVGERVHNVFPEVFRDFTGSIEMFEKSIPIMMAYLPNIGALGTDRRVRQFIKGVGKLLEDGDFEVYEFDPRHIHELTKRLKHSTLLAEGIVVLPAMFLVGLVAAYDVFFSKLIRAVLITRSEILSSSDGKLTIRDLLDAGSVERAIEQIIDRETEEIMRGSHEDHIRWFEKKLNIDIIKNLGVWPEFVEICERRNLLSHTDGVVSQQYIDVCARHGSKTNGAKVGDKLRIQGKYYFRAVTVIQEIGIKLTQILWRKIRPEDVERADGEINIFAYERIVDGRYHEAAEILRFALNVVPTPRRHARKEADKKRLTVNYANAIKLGGDMAGAKRILDAEDWSAVTDDFKICVAAVRDDADMVARMMKAAVDSTDLTAESFRKWPVFEKVRQTPQFAEAFESTFGEKLSAGHSSVEAEARQADEADSDEAHSETAETATNDERGNAQTVH